MSGRYGKYGDFKRKEKLRNSKKIELGRILVLELTRKKEEGIRGKNKMVRTKRVSRMITKEFSVPKLVTNCVIEELENIFNKEVPKLFYNIEVENYYLKISVPNFLKYFLEKIVVECLNIRGTYEGIGYTYRIYIPGKGKYEITYNEFSPGEAGYIGIIHFYDPINKRGYISDKRSSLVQDINNSRVHF